MIRHRDTVPSSNLPDISVQDDRGTKAKMAGVAEYRRCVMAAGSTVPIGMVRVP